MAPEIPIISPWEFNKQTKVTLIEHCQKSITFSFFVFSEILTLEITPFLHKYNVEKFGIDIETLNMGTLKLEDHYIQDKETLKI